MRWLSDTYNNAPNSSSSPPGSQPPLFSIGVYQHVSATARRPPLVNVKTLTQTTDDQVRESTASAIDLAGSEDNRRAENGKEMLVESAAISKSLFVLTQCIDAMFRGDKRIPYRESKMTRILSLGQNNSITIMIHLRRDAEDDQPAASVRPDMPMQDGPRPRGCGSYSCHRAQIGFDVGAPLPSRWSQQPDSLASI
ncbi:P-loop containing nucleoside triphosphate hydrolase protein [Colletotrichum cereale]|nr:P-loop containing nucleoside triphosphate hydrolase protein [Colletotrichum cereale]